MKETTTETSISTGQLLLNYLFFKAHEKNEKITEERLFKDIRRIVDKLRNEGVHSSIILKGNKEEVRSEELDDHLWYWIGNGFMDEEVSSGELRIDEKFWVYFNEDRINNEVNANLTPQVKEKIRETINEV